MTGGRGHTALRRELLRFLVAGLVAALVALVVVGVLSRTMAKRGAQEELLRTGTAIADYLVAPLVDDRVRAGDPVAVRTLDQAVRTRQKDGRLVRLKVWDADGTIVYSDEPRLVGRRYGLGADERQALRTATATVDLSDTVDLQDPENAFERQAGPLLETYVGTRDATGRPVLVELYFPAESLGDATRRLELTGSLAAAVGIVVLLLVVVPLALRLARRVDRARADEQAARERALRAAEVERLRVAAHLHDTAIPHLAAAGYLIGAAQAGGGGETVPAPLTRAEELVSTGIDELRGLLGDLFPPAATEDLPRSLADLCQRFEDQRPPGSPRTTAELDLEPDLSTGDVAAAATYRIVRECLSNVRAHSGATRVRVTMRREGDVVVLRVSDDGQGFDAEAPAPDGHFGRRLMASAVADAGGRLTVRATPGGGCTVEARLPDRLPSRIR